MSYDVDFAICDIPPSITTMHPKNYTHSSRLMMSCSEVPIDHWLRHDNMFSRGYHPKKLGSGVTNGWLFSGQMRLFSDWLFYKSSQGQIPRERSSKDPFSASLCSRLCHRNICYFRGAAMERQRSWAPSQYPKRRLSVRSRQVSKPQDLYLELSDRSEFDRHFGSSAADVPVKFQSDTTI